MPPKNKKELQPMTHQERVQIMREAMRLSIGDFLENRKKELDQALLGVVKRFFWYLIVAVLIFFIHVLLHGRYQKLADIFVQALGS